LKIYLLSEKSDKIQNLEDENQTFKTACSLVSSKFKVTFNIFV